MRYAVQLHAHRRYIFTDPEKAYNFAKFFKMKAFEFTSRVLGPFDHVVS